MDTTYVARHGPCALAAWPFFWTLAFGHHITNSRLLGHIAPRETCFFDKFCVHQSDKELKDAGVRSIAAIVARSQRMVALWSPTYFTRLWCTLECAALVHAAEVNANKRERLPLTLYPIAIANNAIMLACVTFAVSALCSFATLPALRSSVEEKQAMLAIMGMSLGVVSPAYMHSLRWYMRQRMLLSSQLEDFSISAAGCSVESDRETICQTIRHWFGSLDAFDHVVRTRVREHVIQAIGSDVKMSRVTMSGLVPFICFKLDHIPMYMGVGGWHGFVLMLSIPSYILWIMAQFQLIHHMARCVARQRHPWAADAAVSFAMGIFWTCAAAVQLLPLELAHYIPMGSAAWFLIRTLICLFFAFLTALLALLN
mmetsp:Transcript_113822/g.316935  ORF Transcript_113822/g.316935 Transcript_113822/m.316935 type:complete len:370 (-) Transcript_113822:15-1124(-)